MSFPREHEHQVDCNGFPEKYLPAIRHAIENKQVIWGKSSLYISLGIAEFEWAGCIWELVEMQEMVTSITLLKGDPIDEDLTIAVLRG